VNRLKTILLLGLLALAATPLFAQENQGGASWAHGVNWGVLSAAIVLGMAAAAGAIGQSRAIAAAVEGIARNPSAAGPIRLSMIIGLALIESLVIYALLIAFFALGE